MDQINWGIALISFLVSFCIGYTIAHFAFLSLSLKKKVIEKDREIDRLRAELRWTKQDLEIQTKSISKLTAYKG